MHTLKVIAAGLLLLGIFLLAGRYIVGKSPAAMVTAAKLFISVWLVTAGINMWTGVSGAGYSVRNEAPFFLVNFAVPAAVALLVLWKR